MFWIWKDRVAELEIKNLAASGRGMKQPLLGFFRRPKGRGIYP